MSNLNNATLEKSIDVVEAQMLERLKHLWEIVNHLRIDANLEDTYGYENELLTIETEIETTIKKIKGYIQDAK